MNSNIIPQLNIGIGKWFDLTTIYEVAHKIINDKNNKYLP